MALDTSDFLEIVEGTETVTYYSRLTTSTFDDAVTVTKAKRRATTKSEMAVSGLLGKTSQTWHVGTDYLSGIVPKIGDKLTDGNGQTWSVKEVAIESFRNRWRLTTIEERA